MLAFTYACGACSHHFEAYTQSSDDEVRCTMCGSTEAKRMVPRVAIRPSNRRRRGMVDLSSNSCPCGCSGGKHARA